MGMKQTRRREAIGSEKQGKGFVQVEIQKRDVGLQQKAWP